MWDNRSRVRIPFSETEAAATFKASAAGSSNDGGFEMSKATPKDFTLDELSEYLGKLSYETISRNPSAPVRFAPLQAEHRARLLIGPEEVSKRRADMSVKNVIKRWVMWTMADASIPEEPQPILTGRILDRRDRPAWLTTSEVRAIASDMSCIFTQSGSLYEISDEAPNMSNDGFVHVVTVLNAWGYQRALNLPPLFY